jgi:hypothetical protein
MTTQERQRRFLNQRVGTRARELMDDLHREIVRLKLGDPMPDNRCGTCGQHVGTLDLISLPITLDLAVANYSCRICKDCAPRAIESLAKGLGLQISVEK